MISVKEIKKTTLTVSALNSENESFKDLSVGDKHTYTTKDAKYEVLISAISGYSVDVTVNKYWYLKKVFLNRTLFLFIIPNELAYKYLLMGKTE